MAGKDIDILQASIGSPLDQEAESADCSDPRIRYFEEEPLDV
jgi:hypothetical protein